MKNKPKWYRKFVLDVDKDVVREAVAKYTQDPEQYTHSRLGGPYCPEDTAGLDGKTLVFRGEGRVLCFGIDGGHKLRFSEDGGKEVQCYCNVKSMDEEVYLVNFLVPGYIDSRQITLIADTKNGNATVCDAHFGTPYSNVDVDREFYFGKLDGDFPEEGPLHGFTNDLVGTAIEWDYGNLQIKHIYVSNLYYTYSHPGGEHGAWMATNPADYIKIRDHLFLFSFVEERQHGLQAIFLIDTEKYHDIGCFYGVSADHVTSACVGAIGKPMPLITIF